MTDRPRRPLQLAPIAREEQNGSDTTTDPPPAFEGITTRGLVEDTARSAELTARRVDVLIRSEREMRADVKTLLAGQISLTADVHDVKAGMFEILGILRPVQADASHARQEATVARVEAAEARKEAARAERIADAARAEASRSSKTEEQLAELVVREHEDALAERAEKRATKSKFFKDVIIPAAKLLAMAAAVYIAARLGVHP